LSLSLLCRDGEASLLSCNAQIVAQEAAELTLKGLRVNIHCSAQQTLIELAGAIARALPGLWGYVGIDLVKTPSCVWVADINPRLTTSYVGLRKLAPVNLADSVLKLLQCEQAMPQITMPANALFIDLNDSPAQSALPDLSPV
jgi:predicted ATP-grasp superfamily ATP-dependent carboligase